MTEIINVPEREQGVDLLAKKIESRIVDGKAELVSEPERRMLRSLVERSGTNLGVLSEGKTLDNEGQQVQALVAQGNKLERALGEREKLISFLSEVIEKTVSEERRGQVAGHVAAYFEINESDDGRLVIYDLNSGNLLDSRIVATVSATHRLLKILSANSEEESLKWQKDEQSSKFLRGRILKGWEKSGKVVLPRQIEVERSEGKLTRSLPVGGLGVIIDVLTRG